MKIPPKIEHTTSLGTTDALAARLHEVRLDACLTGREIAEQAGWYPKTGTALHC